MSITLDPRRLTSLKQLAAEAGVRPGELVRAWVEERIDAERRGDRPTRAATGIKDPLLTRVEELAARVSALEASVAAPEKAAPADARPVGAAAETSPATAAPKRRGRPPKPKPKAKRATAEPRIALHDEMVAVIEERGPSTAAELAEAISERGRYAPPRSGKALDAATVSARVSNPTYRSRFTRAEGRIGLAEPNAG